MESNVPQPPVESIDDLSHRRTDKARINKRTSKYTAPPNPPGRSPAEHAVTRRPTAVLPGSRITTPGFPCLLSTE